jgi:TolA-binding protein
MDKLFDQAPKIIEEAAKSPLGLLALMIIALSVLAFLFFRQVSPHIRVGMFLVVFLGFVLLGAALYQVIPSASGGQSTQRPLTSGTVVKLERLPAVPKDAADLGEWYVAWLKEFFDAQIIIDRGSLQGTKQGDYFVAVQDEKEIQSKEGRALGIMREEGSLVRVVDAHPKFSICQLTDFTYGSHFKALEARLTKAADKDGQIDLEKHAELLAPVTVGQKVIAIPQEEKARRDEIEEAYGRTLAESTKDEERNLRYADMIVAADKFLVEHATGYFAPNALFQKGFAQFKLGQYRDSINTFELFLTRYPFHVSAPGAKDWIEKATKAMKEAQAVAR